MTRIVAVILILLLSGCVTTQPLPLNSSEGRAEINTRAERGQAVVFVEGEPGRHVLALHIAPDVTTWIHPRTREVGSVPTDRVARVTFLRAGTGALKGLGIGTVVGAGVGLLADASDDGVGFLSFSTAGWITLVGISGALHGALVGAAYADRHVYRREAAGIVPDSSDRPLCGGRHPPCEPDEEE